MSKYYNTYDRVFISNPDSIKNEVVIDKTGASTITGDITGMSVIIACIWVDEATGKPIYGDVESPKCFDDPKDKGIVVTYNYEVGILIIPKQTEGQHTGQKVGYKITEYLVEMIKPDATTATIPVSENEFVRIMRKHFHAFNNQNNYHAQNSVVHHVGTTEEPARKCWYTGYDQNGIAVITDEHGLKDIITLFYPAGTQEDAEEFRVLLRKITPYELKSIQYSKQGRKNVLQSVKELIQIKEGAAS